MPVSAPRGSAFTAHPRAGPRRGFLRGRQPLAKDREVWEYMPHRSHPLHFSGATTCGGWYPLELEAEESASTLVGQNSTQKPQALQRSTTMETRPFATGPPLW